MRRAAGNLGLLIVRRCSSFAAEKKKKKCLYLCFRDLLGPHSRDVKQVIRPIPWNSGDEGETEILVDAVDSTSRFYNPCFFKVSSFGSLIIFPRGTHSLDVCWVDTSKRPLDFQIFPHDKTVPTTLKNYHPNLMLGEVDGKLYRMDNHVHRFNLDPDYCAFQVFNPKKTETGAWLPLSTPPFTQILHRHYDVIFLDEGKKIIGWGTGDCELWFFDTTRPEIGWTYLYLGDLHTGAPFFGLSYTPLFVLNHHPDIGDFYFMFQYHPETLSVSATFISVDFKDYYYPVHTQFKLLELCSKSDLSEYISLYKKRGISDYELVHLGAQRVAIVFHKYVNKNGGEKPGSILVVAFEYEFTDTKLPAIKFRTRLIKIRRFKYHYDHPGQLNLSYDVRLNGAFLL